MLVHSCDIKGCRFRSEDASVFKHLDLSDLIDDEEVIAAIRAKDICPACAEKLINSVSAKSTADPDSVLYNACVRKKYSRTKESLTSRPSPILVRSYMLFKYLKYSAQQCANTLNLKRMDVSSVCKDKRADVDMVLSDICDRYCAGCTLAELAEEYHIVPEELRRFLADNVPKEYKRIDVSWTNDLSKPTCSEKAQKAIMALYAAGVDLDTIADKTCEPLSNVVKTLNKHMQED